MILHILNLVGITGNGRMYNFWSGFGSDLGEAAIVAAIARHINCAHHGCWRLGHHINGHVLCHKHRTPATP